jgi:hypothetical protein
MSFRPEGNEKLQDINFRTIERRIWPLRRITLTTGVEQIKAKVPSLKGNPETGRAARPQRMHPTAPVLVCGQNLLRSAPQVKEPIIEGENTGAATGEGQVRKSLERDLLPVQEISNPHGNARISQPLVTLKSGNAALRAAIAVLVVPKGENVILALGNGALSRVIEVQKNGN